MMLLCANLKATHHKNDVCTAKRSVMVMNVMGSHMRSQNYGFVSKYRGCKLKNPQAH